MIKAGGKRLKDYDPDLFIYSVDLREDNRIVLGARAFGKNAINNAELLPNDKYRRNEDYTVDTTDKDRAVIRLRNLEKFENERFVIVLR